MNLGTTADSVARVQAVARVGTPEAAPRPKRARDPEIRGDSIVNASTARRPNAMITDLAALADLREITLPRTPEPDSPLLRRLSFSLLPEHPAGRDALWIAGSKRPHTLITYWRDGAPTSAASNKRYAEFMADAVNGAALQVRRGIITTLGSLYECAIADRQRALLLDIGFRAGEVRTFAAERLRSFSTRDLYDAASLHFRTTADPLKIRALSIESAKALLAEHHFPIDIREADLVAIESTLDASSSRRDLGQRSHAGRIAAARTRLRKRAESLSDSQRRALTEILADHFTALHGSTASDIRTRGAVNAANIVLCRDFLRQYRQTGYYALDRQPETRLTGRYAAAIFPHLITGMNRTSAESTGSQVVRLTRRGESNRADFWYSNDGDAKNGFVFTGTCDVDDRSHVIAVVDGSAKLEFHGSATAAETYHQAAAESYRLALASSDHVTAIKHGLDGYWASVQRGIAERGNAATTEYALRAVLLARGIDLPLTPKGVALDLEALVSPREQFVTAFLRAFAAEPVREPVSIAAGADI